MDRRTLRLDNDGYRIPKAPVDGVYGVLAPDGITVYHVDPEAGSCTCPHGRYGRIKRVCKHIQVLWTLREMCPWIT